MVVPIKLHVMTTNDFRIKVLGEATVPSSLKPSSLSNGQAFGFVEDDDRVLYNVKLSRLNKELEVGDEPISFEKAGPHQNLFFKPEKTKAAIVTCGGLCPGLNNVIQSIVYQLYYRYNVSQIVGIRYGYEGFINKYNHSFMNLTPKSIDTIHHYGGSILGSSRGEQDVGLIVDKIRELGVSILFCIGGDGTLRGAHAIHEEVSRRGMSVSVVGIPKTIDNDISFIDKSFGFETAFSIANDIIRSAHNEAIGAYNGIVIVKLMGRDSGFIAANAALAVKEVNFVLIPEDRFDLHGSQGFLSVLQDRLERRHHALIVVAEGAGQYFFDESTFEKDASGNLINKDIGLYLKSKIKEEFNAQQFRYSLKYIDPSYIIRSAPANANDSKFCGLLAQNAVHAAMAGRTDFVIGYWNHQFILLPIPMAVSERKKIDVEGELWWNVLETTGQPKSFIN